MKELDKQTKAIKTIINNDNYSDNEKLTLYNDYSSYFKKVYIKMFQIKEHNKEVKDRAKRIQRIRKSKTGS
jgi:hypothetical protein